MSALQHSNVLWAPNSLWPGVQAIPPGPPTPVVTDGLLTEAGEFLITEDGDFLIQE